MVFQLTQNTGIRAEVTTTLANPLDSGVYLRSGDVISTHLEHAGGDVSLLEVWASEPQVGLSARQPVRQQSRRAALTSSPTSSLEAGICKGLAWAGALHTCSHWHGFSLSPCKDRS